jgi:hypothetical protein
MKTASVALEFRGDIIVSPADGRVYIAAEQDEKTILEMAVSILSSIDNIGASSEAAENLQKDLYNRLGYR